MKSPLICLLPVLAFALYPLERARAIGMSLGSGYTESWAGPLESDYSFWTETSQIVLRQHYDEAVVGMN
jgi:hypothetical protein